MDTVQRNGSQAAVFPIDDITQTVMFAGAHFSSYLKNVHHRQTDLIKMLSSMAMGIKILSE